MYVCMYVYIYTHTYCILIRQAHIKNGAKLIWILVRGTEDDVLRVNIHIAIFLHNNWAKILLLMSWIIEILKDNSPLFTRSYYEAVQSSLSNHAPFLRSISILFAYPRLHCQNNDDVTFSPPVCSFRPFHVLLCFWYAKKVGNFYVMKNFNKITIR